MLNCWRLQHLQTVVLNIKELRGNKWVLTRHGEIKMTNLNKGPLPPRKGWTGEDSVGILVETVRFTHLFHELSLKGNAILDIEGVYILSDFISLMIVVTATLDFDEHSMVRRKIAWQIFSPLFILLSV